MKLLIERNFEEISVINHVLTEGDKNEKEYFIEGVFLQAEIKNHNGRIYPRDIMRNEVNRYIDRKIKTEQAIGELDHPDKPSINLDRVSHKIISLTESGNNWIGKAKIINTPMGKIVKNLIDEGIKFGTSSRALGSLRETNNAKFVQNDFYLITPSDIVSDPSGPDCMVTAIMEDREWFFENDKIVEKRDMFRREIDKTAKTGLNEAALLLVFNSILSKI